MNNRRPGWLTLGLLGLAAFATAADGQAGPSSKPVLSQAEAQKKLDKAASRFIENVGQWSPEALFLARSKNLNTWVTRDGVVYDTFRQVKSGSAEGVEGQAIHMSFEGGQGGVATGVDRHRMLTDFIQSPSARKQTAASFGQIISKGIYPGVDARYYFENGRPRYDLIVGAGVDPSGVRLSFKGANSVRVENNEIKLGTKLGDLRHGKLFVYQVVNGRRKAVPASFKLVDKDSVAFQIGAYDKSRDLIIDPLVYGSYYGGDNGVDEVRAVATDREGGVYLTGFTQATQFPAIYGPYGFNLRGRDAFVSKLQGDAYAHDYAAFIGGSQIDFGQFLAIDPFGDLWLAGRTQSANFPGNTRENVMYMRRSGTPSGGTFRLSYPGAGATAPLPFNATADQVEAALDGLLNTTTDVQAFPAGSLASAGGTYRIALPNQFPELLAVTNNLMTPAGTSYTFSKTTDIFVMRFRRSTTTVLDPFPQATQIFGGDQDERLSSFSVRPNENPQLGTPVEFAFSGNMQATILNIPVNNPDMPAPLPSSDAAFMARYRYAPAGNSFSVDAANTRWVTGGSGIDLTGLVIDREGSVYIGGTVFFNGNADTSLPGAPFQTTAGVFPEGRLLRNDDIFVRKYDANGLMLYSALIGGNNFDSAGGWDTDLGGAYYNTGSTIAVDSSLNLYVTGISNSFNFPRTRGVYGEVFDNNWVTTVTKINPDASQILYSTNLRTSGPVFPAGIAVDARGNAFVTHNIHIRQVLFPENQGQTAGNPNEPTSQTQANIPVTSDALDPLYEVPPTPELYTREGAMQVLNPAATDVVYASYIGGILDEAIYAPYVDRFGDVWVCGWTDSTRAYSRPTQNGPPKQYIRNGSLPASLISPLAFKSTGDATGGTGFTVLYGALNPQYPIVNPTSWDPAGMPPGFPIPTASMTFWRDGFIIKKRVGLASVANIILNPTTVPGGLGAFTSATVVLSEPAPAGGASVELTLNSPAASFNQNTQQNTLIVTIPGGQTQTDPANPIQIYTRPVTTNTSVLVRATYQGSFIARQFTVTPWLQQLTLAPTSVVGGNSSSGRITLAAPAPGPNGVTVELITDTPGLISFPGGSTVTVPAGQQSVSFTINTEGVPTTTNPTITASLLGVGKTQTLTLTPASLQSVTFQPQRVAGGSSSTGTVTLDGEAGSTFTVDLEIDAGTPGYVISPQQLTFNAGERSKTFTVTTAFESQNTQRRITARRGSEAVSGTLFIDAISLSTFTISPTRVNGGATSTGTVTISGPAPAGGVVVNLASSNTDVATVPATVTVPQGASTASFQITTKPIGSDQDVVITASRGPVSIPRTLSVTGVSFTITVPESVVGGTTVLGRVNLPTRISSGTATVTISSSNSAVASVSPTTLVFGPNDLEKTFTITTAAVTARTNVTFTATLDGKTQTASMEVRPVGISSVQVRPNRVRGGTSEVVVRVTLDSAAQDSGVISITYSNEGVIRQPIRRSVPVVAGQEFVEFTIRTNRVTRNLATTITATFNGTSASDTLLVTR